MGHLIDLDKLILTNIHKCFLCGAEQTRSRQTQTLLHQAWYSLPDVESVVRDANGRAAIPPSTTTYHKSMREVVTHLLTCSDGETSCCRQEACDSKAQYGCTQNHIQPDRHILPKRLTMETGTGTQPNSGFHAELEFEVGGVRYKRVSVTFCNGSHYRCKVLYNNRWYAYDGMGVGHGRSNRLLECDPDSIPAWYQPCCYTYIRCDNLLGGVCPTGLEPLGYRQFHRMARVWDEGLS